MPCPCHFMHCPCSPDSPHPPHCSPFPHTVLSATGGGFLINPILLGLHVHPQVVGGTAKIILLLSVASTSAAYLLTGRVLVTYGLAYGMVVLVMTPVGIWAMDWVISRTGRASHLVLLALVRFAVGIVLVVAFDFVPAMVHLAHAGVEGFHPERLCEQH